MRPAELFIVCDGQGTDYVCKLSETVGAAEIIEARPSLGEPTIKCSVYIAMAKGDRMEYAVQKSIELGAYEIIVFTSERCVSIPGDIAKKTARLQRIALETAKQCGRGRVPEVTAVPSYEAAIKQAASAKLPLFFYEDEEKMHLKDALVQGTGDRGQTVGRGIPDAPGAVDISIMTGPEGGFAPQEAKLAQEAGMIAVTLGPRILRCETAPIVALAAIMYETDNL